MTLRLGHKLFLAFVLTTAAVVGILVVTQRYSFQRGFLDYIEGIETAALDALGVELEHHYAEEESWEFIAGYERWPRYLLAAMMGIDRPQREFFRPIGGKRPRPDRFPGPGGSPFREAARSMSPAARLGLYDANNEWVVGARVDHDAPLERVLQHDGVTIGRLLMTPQEKMIDGLDLQFVRQQRRGLYWAAAVIFIAAAVAAALVARSLGKPIRELARGAFALAGGQYDTRIELARRDELGRLANDFNTLADTLEKNRAARRQWVVDISHELRTPIAILKGELEALEDGVRKLDGQALRSLSAEVQRLGSLVTDLYELARSDAGALSYAKKAMALDGLLDEIGTTFASRLAERGLTLELDIAAAAPVFADPERLRQLFTNLLENALRYSHEGGTVRIRCARNEDHVGVTVEDSAPGVPDEALPRLFDRLYRVEPSRSRETGAAGLGLAICANIVSAHDGRISARHSALGGVAIDVELPLHKEG